MPKKLSNQVSLIGEKVEIDQQTISQTIKESQRKSNSLAEEMMTLNERNKEVEKLLEKVNRQKAKVEKELNEIKDGIMEAV